MINLRAKELDQFYTNPDVAKECVELLKKHIDIKKYDLLLEPSAGDGAFLNNLPKNKRIGVDLDPQHPEIKKKNFFDYFPKKGQKVITVGNPPFGKRSKLSIQFFQHASLFSDVIAFIVPLQWKKWSVQSQIPEGWELILDHQLREKAFIHNGKECGVRCSFQIWKKGNSPSLRLTEKPVITHKDFDMFLYNNTPEAEKFFSYEWDFAVPRQGWADYSRRETKKENCERTTQWIFFKAKSKSIKERLMRIDFEKLAQKNTSTPGWGKADLVELYSELYD